MVVAVEVEIALEPREEREDTAVAPFGVSGGGPTVKVHARAADEVRAIDRRRAAEPPPTRDGDAPSRGQSRRKRPVILVPGHGGGDTGSVQEFGREVRAIGVVGAGLK